MRTINPTGLVFFGDFTCTHKATPLHRSESPLSQTTRGQSPRAHTSALKVDFRKASCVLHRPVLSSRLHDEVFTKIYGATVQARFSCSWFPGVRAVKWLEPADLEQVWGDVPIKSWWLVRSQCSLNCYLRYLKLKSSQICCSAGVFLLKDEFLSKTF